MVALFDSVLSKTVFNLLASCSFMFLCYLMASTATDDKAKVPPLMILSAFLLWFVVPGFFQACLWKSGVCNYLFRGLDSVVLSFCYFCHTWEDKCFPMCIMGLVRLCGRMDQRGLCP